MKKVLSLLTVFALTVCCLFMVACSPAGTYKFESLHYEQNGVVIDVTAGEEFMGVTFTEDFMILKLNDDGTGEIVFQGETTPITWVKEDKVVKVTAEGEVEEFTISGNKLTVSMDGAELVLKK